MADEKTKKSKTKLKKPSPLGFLARGLKKGIKRVGKRVKTDLLPLEGRTVFTSKLKKPKNPKRTVKATREDSVQLEKGNKRNAIIKPGQIRNTRNTPVLAGEKTVSKVTGAVIPGKGRKRPGVGRLQKSASLKKVADIDKKVTQRNIRRFGTRAAAIAAGFYTGKKIYDAATGPKTPMAGTDTSSSGGSRTVKSGQTLSQIAKDNGTTLKALLAANPSIKNANKIKVGQKIKLSKPVKKRKSVYQGISKAGMKKMAMPKKKKMGGGKVYKRGGGKALRGFGNATYSNKMI